MVYRELGVRSTEGAQARQPLHRPPEVSRAPSVLPVCGPILQLSRLTCRIHSTGPGNASFSTLGSWEILRTRELPADPKQRELEAGGPELSAEADVRPPRSSRACLRYLVTSMAKISVVPGSVVSVMTNGTAWPIR